MKTLTVGKFKSEFSQVIRNVENGEEIIVSYGKNKRMIAVIIPFSSYKKKTPVKLGILENKAKFETAPDFKMTDEELLKS